MEERTKQFVMRMIPYGVHVLSAVGPSGKPVLWTAHWVMQTSFKPTLIAAAVPVGSEIYAAIESSKRFAVHMLGKDDAAEAFAFQTRPASLEGGTLSGWGFAWSQSGLPLLHDAPGVLECSLLGFVNAGDHHTAMAEVTEVFMRLPELSRPDKMILHLSEMGDTIFYGG